MCAKDLADLLSIFQTAGFTQAQGKDLLKSGAVDVDSDVKLLRTELSGYKPTGCSDQVCFCSCCKATCFW